MAKVTQGSPRLTVYRRIENDMRTRVARGIWPGGMMIPSRKALAKSYGVDLRTVQRAIAELLTDGTLIAENGRGTFVARSAARPPAPLYRHALQTNQTIAIVIDLSMDATGAGPLAVSQAIGAALRRSSPESRIVTFDTHADTMEQIGSLEREALDILEQDNVTGAIVWHAGGEQTEPQLRRIVEHGIPIVLIDRCPDNVACDFVGIDNTYSAREAVDYLISLGHRRIGFLAPLEQINTIDERLQGYRTAMLRSGLEPDPKLEFRTALQRSLNVGDLDDDLRSIVHAIQTMPEPPTAIFAVNDFLAHHLISAVESEGGRVPDDLSIVGFDDIDRFSPRPPLISTMHQPFEAMGERAAEMLLSRIEGSAAIDAPRTPCRHVLLATRLIARESCRRCHNEDDRGRSVRNGAGPEPQNFRL